jgi:chemotaxis protein methyltransferase CheR
MSNNSTSLVISPSQFNKISGLVYRASGIDLRAGKQELVKSRLARRLQALGVKDFEQYLGYIERDQSGQELMNMVESLTTNKTCFFREPAHFDYLRQQILPRLNAAPRIRIWSAGCSSGEEAYSIAMLLRETLRDIDRRDVRILATDLSTEMLARAREGLYQAETLGEMPAALLRKHFTREEGQPAPAYRINPDLKAMVRLARLNLMEAWPMKGAFDLIFCRNVMIYFDKPTQQALVGRFWKLLSPGGHLFVGHAESLIAAAHGFRYVQPAIYVK